MAVNSTQIKRSIEKQISDAKFSLTKMAEGNPAYQDIDISIVNGNVTVNTNLVDIYKSYEFYFQTVYSNILALKEVVNSMVTNVTKYTLADSKNSPEIIEASVDYEKGVSEYYNLMNYQMVNGAKTVSDIQLGASGDSHGNLQYIIVKGVTNWSGSTYVSNSVYNSGNYGNTFVYGDTAFEEFVFTFNTDLKNKIYYIKNLSCDGNTTYLTYGMGDSYTLPSSITAYSDDDCIKIISYLNKISTNLNNKAYESDGNRELAKTLVENTLFNISLLNSNRKGLVESRVERLLTELKYADDINPKTAY